MVPRFGELCPSLLDRLFCILNKGDDKGMAWDEFLVAAFIIRYGTRDHRMKCEFTALFLCPFGLFLDHPHCTPCMLAWYLFVAVFVSVSHPITAVGKLVMKGERLVAFSLASFSMK